MTVVNSSNVVALPLRSHVAPARPGVRVAVIGGGIIGLSIARLLASAGLGEVVVYFDQPIHHLASWLAAGLVEPVAGPEDPAGTELELELFARSFPAWQASAANNRLVVAREVTAYSRGRDQPFAWHSSVNGYRELTAAEMHSSYRDGEAARFSTFVVDTPGWLSQLKLQLGRHGVKFISRHVASFNELSGFDAVVNATGLAAAELTGDTTMVGKDGHVVYLERPAGYTEVFMEEARAPEAVLADPFGVNMAYIIPRIHDVVLGGTLFTRTKLDETPALIPGMAQHLIEMLTEIDPRLAGAKLLGYRAGTRPCRRAGTRLEWGADRSEIPVLHAYGCGGSGWTLAPGIAETAVRMLRQELFGGARKAG